jgi:hypothetical protein
MMYFDRFRMVVVETKSQIDEMEEHLMASARHSSTASHLKNGKLSSSLVFVCLSFTTFPTKKRQSTHNQCSSSSTDPQLEMFQLTHQRFTRYDRHLWRVHDIETDSISMYNRI